jgi:DNA polymerase-3 subunit gamma/tau
MPQKLRGQLSASCPTKSLPSLAARDLLTWFDIQDNQDNQKTLIRGCSIVHNQGICSTHPCLNLEEVQKIRCGSPMTYQPLHHKYRPQSFADLVGQAAIATTLSNALQQQRIAPAYLFTGARGTGKTSSARILAKSLNCLSSDTPTAQPCGVCEVCRAIANGSALDVIEIDAASNTGVDNIRELIERAQFAPVQCRYKVYTIDECHMLSTAAFNALLKTLEEPPDRVVFILATTDPQRVLPTIISRCQRFDFRRIPLAAISEHLRLIADKEAILISDEAITLVGQIAQGGLRDAESLLDQLSLLPGEIGVEQVWDLVGAVPERDLMALLSAIAANDAETLLDQVRRLMDRGREPLIVLQNLASFYRDLLIAKTAPDRADLVTLTAPTWTALCEFAQTLDLGIILSGQQHLRASEVQIKTTTQPRLWLEVSLLGLLPAATARSQPINNQSISQPPKLTEPDQLPPLKPASSPPPRSEQPPAPASIAPVPEPPAPLPPESQASSTPQPVSESAIDLNEVWQAMLQQLQMPSTRMLLSQQGCLLGLTEHDVRVGIIPQWYKTVKLKVDNLQAAFEQVLKRPVTVQLEMAAPADLKAAQGSPPTRFSTNDTDNPAPLDRHPSSLQLDPPPALPSPPAPPFPEPPSAPSFLAREAIEPPAGWQQEDELTQASKQLADFFGGRIVDLGGSDASTESGTTETPQKPESLEPNSDSEADSDDEIAF